MSNKLLEAMKLAVQGYSARQIKTIIKKIN